MEGYETSALTLNNILYYLAKNKNVQDTLRQEIDSVLNEGNITFETLNAMPYLNSVFLGRFWSRKFFFFFGGGGAELK